LNRRRLFFVLLILFLLIPVYSQDSETPGNGAVEGEENGDAEYYRSVYELGDQVFNITAGLFIPLYYRRPGDFSTAPANLSLGGTGSIEYSSFINSNMTLGLSLKGMFAYTPNERLLSMFPITGKLTYYLTDSYPFEFPLYVHAGLCISRLESETFYGPTIMPGAGATWNMNSSWGFGINATWWWVPMWYGPSHEDTAKSRFGNFLDISLSATYHF